MRRINTLEALRFFAFMSIFLLHTSSYHFINFFYNAAWGVSFFITLSGFLNGYKYYDYEERISFKVIKDFTIKRIKKFYPLHLAMLMAALPLSGITVIINKRSTVDMITWSKKLIVNILLLQDYFSKNYFAFNGVSWFLSLMVFLSIITIPLLIGLSKIGKKHNGTIKLLLLMIVILLADLAYIMYIKKHSSNLEYWLYIFPPSKIPEYFGGMIIGSIIRKKENKINIKIFTLLEISSIILLLVIFKYFASQEWQWRGINWIIPDMFLIAVFSFERGIISKILRNRLLVWLGSITFEAFLIHQILLRYFDLAVPSENFNRLAKLFAEVYIFSFTMIISNFVHSLSKKTLKLKDV